MTDWTRSTANVLHWEPEGQRSWQLRLHDTGVGRIAWQSACGSLARATCAQGEWTLKRMGFFHPYITVRRAGSTEDLARMQTVRRETRLVLGDGRYFRWARTRPRAREAAFSEASGRTLVTFSPVSRHGAFTGSLTLGHVEAEPETLAMLAMVGWYRLVLEQMDEEAAMMTATMAAVNAAVYS